MKVKFHISTAGEAGNPHKLLVGTAEDKKLESALFTEGSLWSLKRAKRKILKKFEILTGRKHIEDI